MAKRTRNISYAEDNFELYSHKKATCAVTRRMIRVRGIRRKIFVGKIILAVAALTTSVLLYYLVTTLVPLF